MQLLEECQSRAEVAQYGGAAAWCAEHGVHTARGRAGTLGRETAWLSRVDTLEVDALLWLPWVFLQSRRNFAETMDLPGDLQVRLNPYFARWVLRQRGTDPPLAGELLRGRFERAARQRQRALRARP